MAGEDARLKAGLKSAEDELNLIKNQIQQTLLDIREHILDVTNPFNNVAPELFDDDEQMSIEESGGIGGGGGESVEGGDTEEIIEDDAGLDDGIEAVKESPESEVLVDDGGGIDGGYEEVPEDEYIEDGGAGGGGGASSGGGGLSDLLGEEPAMIDEPQAGEAFEPDEDPAPAFETGIEDNAPMEQELLEDPTPADIVDAVDDPMAFDEPMTVDEPMDVPMDVPTDVPTTTGDGVADAVTAALAANVDLLTLASLVRWTAITRERIGANRLDILLDAYEMAGRISPQMKNVVRALSALGDEDEDGIPVRDVVTAMVRMEGVINSEETRESNRLLGLLLEMDEDPLDYLAA